ncbi:hypothetical protein quinque_012031 [Culex quinquefasciatus]|uniref:Uncharacterized protein n=1 Tax=Culex quinquefasciatus TaxID=7176 RepID=A0A1S4KI11_CULQU|nr:uncharacterized protein LOC119767981 [Culex quinquefasciatus]
MFKFLIVVLAVIAAALAAPQVFYNTPVSYAYSSGVVRPSFYSGSYVPTAYSTGSYVASPAAAYSYGAYPYAYL